MVSSSRVRLLALRFMLKVQRIWLRLFKDIPKIKDIEKFKEAGCENYS
jgi:hypothetical protein